MQIAAYLIYSAPRRTSSVERPASASLEYRAPRALGSAVGAARSDLLASSTGSAELSPPLACHRTASSAGARELVVPTPTSSTTDCLGSTSAATGGLHFI